MRENYHIEKFTVIADAGMLSESNLTDLEEHGINYVVGARIGHLKTADVSDITLELAQTDNDEAIARTDYYLRNPAKVLKRSKFLASNGKKSFTLNERLVEKQRQLEGIKGYKTNITDVSFELLIARYKDLWKIEQSFRIAKSDLKARPIYHRLEASIKYHLLIVFVALCLTRVIERKEGVTIKQVTDELKDKWTITLKDSISGNTLDVLLDKKPH